MLGKKTGGRVKGSLNKRRVDVQERILELGCDPIEGMAAIALDNEAPLELRARMFSELAQYIWPKLRSVEQTTEITHNYVARVPQAQPKVDEWLKQHGELKEHPTAQ